MIFVVVLKTSLQVYAVLVAAFLSQDIDVMLSVQFNNKGNSCEHDEGSLENQRVTAA